jgi:hypothetical protein
VPDAQDGAPQSFKAKLTSDLLLKNLLDAADFLLNLAADLLGGSFLLKVRVIGGMADLFYSSCP